MSLENPFETRFREISSNVKTYMNSMETRRSLRHRLPTEMKAIHAKSNYSNVATRCM